MFFSSTAVFNCGLCPHLAGSVPVTILRSSAAVISLDGFPGRKLQGSLFFGEKRCLSWMYTHTYMLPMKIMCMPVYKTYTRILTCMLHVIYWFATADDLSVNWRLVPASRAGMTTFVQSFLRCLKDRSVPGYRDPTSLWAGNTVHLRPGNVVLTMVTSWSLLALNCLVLRRNDTLKARNGARRPVVV